MTRRPCRGRGISIHTPARGVTVDRLRYSLHTKISIHTPARGVTPFPCVANFFTSISIHTPARGVTVEGEWVDRSKEFRSTPPRGG